MPPWKLKRANSNARGNGTAMADESNPLLASTDDRSNGESGLRGDDDAIERLVPIEDLMYSPQVAFKHFLTTEEKINKFLLQ